MGKSKQKNPTTRFLMRSFIGLLIFSIIVFSLLGIYMSRKSEKAVYEIGKIYMPGMNQQCPGTLKLSLNCALAKSVVLSPLSQQTMSMKKNYTRNSFTGRRSEDLTIWRFVLPREIFRHFMESQYSR